MQKKKDILDEKGFQRILQMAKEGMSDKQIAEQLGITWRTFESWRKKDSDLQKLIEKGRDEVTQQIEDALVKRAIGFTYRETVWERVPMKDENGKTMVNETGEAQYELAVVKEVVKESPPDLSALTFWLKSRMPEKWGGKELVENNQPIIVQLPEQFKTED